MAENTAYDVSILDLMLPLKDGIAVCSDLRANNVNTPILMLTGKDTRDDVVKGIDFGANDYQVKPFDFNELVARVCVLMRHQAMPES